ncbi:type III restriction-modification system methyltransferase [Candidatus Omnitrophus magneticus]|uniref:site-specific DNA-methyltransferase (adenine-specific) n=1 Tax=Candidatus Omnitrophus magneticus TaxID=1609969 RepID=A0A0F0CMW3_9BACT|nr:type III restriction-modification system methyltransferase [Candidatus Omnitrophus magneticus]
MAEAKKADLKSMDIPEDKLRQLKQVFPEVFTEGLKVDPDKLRLVLGENLDTGRERFGMNWPGKADCFKNIQAPSVATLIPAKEESVNFDSTENLFLEGDNLEVLKLLQKSYYGKIKMIYIDPPYNTGNDFIYPDNYAESLDTYLRYSGQLDEEGRKYSTNTEADGRFHSKWLNMMYPRLYLARNLLKPEGVIFISINDVEVDNLKKLCNEIFGEENFISQLVWENKEGGGGSDSTYFRIKHEYILCYSRNKETALIEGVEISNEDRYTEKDEYFEKRGPYYLQKLNQASIQYSKSLDYAIISPDSKELWPAQGEKRACWRWSKEKVAWGVTNGFIEFKKDREGVWQVYSKQYLNVDNEDQPIERKNRPLAVIDRFSSTQGSKQMESLIGPKIFSYPKPKELLEYLISLIDVQNDIVLDFFAGSATTAQAIIDSNKKDGGRRKFICVQLPEKTDIDSQAYEAGYKTIADIGKERIRRVIKKTQEEQKEHLDFKSSDFDMGFKVFKLMQSNFRLWEGSVDPNKAVVEKQLEMHVAHINSKSSQEDILFELLLKAGFELTTKIEKVSMAEKMVYSIEGGLMLICLEKELTTEVIKAMAENNPSRVICLDQGFEGNDQLKTNAVQIMKSKGVEDFRTV